MAGFLRSLERFVLAADKKTVYRWLRHNYPGSAFLRYAGGYLFWLAYSRRPYVGTRVVEIPWAMDRLKRDTKPGQRLLVVGDVITAKLADMSYDIDLVDMDAEASSNGHLRVQKMDIRRAELPAGAFDAAVCISTIEHVGVQGMEFPDGDRLAAGIIHRALKRGGKLLLTAPFGKPFTVTGFTRIYDSAGLANALKGYFAVDEELYYLWDGFRWKRVDLAAGEQAGFLRSDPAKYPGQNLGLVLVTARKE